MASLFNRFVHTLFLGILTFLAISANLLWYQTHLILKRDVSHQTIKNTTEHNEGMFDIPINKSGDLHFNTSSYNQHHITTTTAATTTTARKSHDKQHVDFYQLEDENIFFYSAFVDHRHGRTTRIIIFGLQDISLQARLVCGYNYKGHIYQFFADAVGAIYAKWPSRGLKYHAYKYSFKLNSTDSVHQITNVTEVVVANYGRYSKGVRIPIKHIGLHRRPTRMGVCVKAIWGHINSQRLVEWIEFNRILGISKFILYDTTITGSARSVLEYYQSLGVVDLVDFAFSLQTSQLMYDDPIRRKLSNDRLVLEQSYLVSLNDCIYRYRDSFHYIAVIDLDEVIVPENKENLYALITRASMEFPTAPSFLFLTAWHLDEYGSSDLGGNISEGLYMQRHLMRTQVMESQPKSIVDTDKVLSVNWHSVITTRIGFSGNTYLSAKDYGFVHHFRNSCKYNVTQCQDIKDHVKVDKMIPRYKERVTNATMSVLNKLDLIH